MKKCEWYNKELEGVAWNYPLCCSQHTKDSHNEMREKHGKAMFDLLTTTEPINPDAGEWDWDNIETFTRTFVSDLPWHRRFLIWLFPRMFDIREYKP